MAEPTCPSRGDCLFSETNFHSIFFKRIFILRLRTDTESFFQIRSCPIANLVRRRPFEKEPKSFLSLRCKDRHDLPNIDKGMVRTKSVIISIVDLTSNAIPKLSEVLKAIPGVQNVDFNLERSVAVVEFDPNQSSSIDDLMHAVLKAGYKVI